MGTGESETQPLLENRYKFGNKNDKSTPTASPTVKKSKIANGIQAIVDYLKIFMVPTIGDKLIILVGIISTLLHGICFLPFAMLLGKLTGSFIQQSIYGFAVKKNLMKNGTHFLTKHQFLESMEEYSIYFIYISGFIFVSSFLQTFLWRYSAENQSCEIRKKLTLHVLNQNLDWFKTSEAQNLHLIMTDSVENVREGVGHKFSKILQYVTTIGVLMALALYTSWKLTTLFLLIWLLTALLIHSMGFGQKLSSIDTTEQAQELEAAASDKARDIFKNARRIYTFGKEGQEISKYRKLLGKAAKSVNLEYFLQSLEVGIFLFFLFGSFAIAFQYSCNVLADDGSSAGLEDIYTIFFIVAISVFSFGQITLWVSILPSAQGSADKLNRFDRCPDNPKIDSNIKETPATVLHKMSGSLKFSGVIFEYPTEPGIKVLNGITFRIDPRKTIGIVGHPKSGKTTIVNLIMRFYDTNSGFVLAENVDIKNLNVRWYRNHIAVVGRHPPQFLPGTILENIVPGQGNIEQYTDKVIGLAKLVNLHDAIYNLEQGYKTELNIFEKQLSDAQKVKLAVVRALARNPRWLILDDSLRCEQSDFVAVAQNIRNYRKELVTILIAKNTETMSQTDFVYLIEEGKVAESGTYKELMKKSGKLYKMFLEQTAAAASARERSVEMEGDIVPVAKGEDIVVQISDEQKPDSKQKYPGIWKMIRITNSGFSNYLWIWLLTGIGCCVSGLVVPALAYYYTYLFLAFGNTSVGSPADIKYWTFAIIILAILSGIGYWMSTLFIHVAGEFMVLELRHLSLNSILVRPLTWFEKKENSPEILETKLRHGGPIIKSILKNQFSSALSGLSTIIAGLTIILFFGWQIGVILAIGLVVIFVLFRFQVLAQRKHQKVWMDQMEAGNLIFNRALEDIWMMQANSLEPYVRKKFLDSISGNFGERQRSCAIFAFTNAFSETFIFLLFGAALFSGAYLIGAGKMEPIVFFRVFIILTFCLITFDHKIPYVPDYTKSEFSFSRILNLIEIGDQLMEKPLETLERSKNSYVLWDKSPMIKFENLSYIEKREKIPVIKSCTLNIPAGKTFVIAGAGGDEGKSNFLNLLLRLYPMAGGRILIEGKDVTKINVTELRDNIGYLPGGPDYELFEGSIFDNIAYGYNGTEEKLSILVDEILQKVGLPQFISTACQPKSAQMKGLTKTEKLKIAIARTLIRQPKILLIDGHTDELIRTDENEIIEILQNGKIGTTCIITTSKPLVVNKLADFVGIFHNSRIVEQGAVEDLRKRAWFTAFNRFIKKDEKEDDPLDDIDEN